MLGALEHPEMWFTGNATEQRNHLLLTSLAAAYQEMENLSEHPFSAMVDEATQARLNVGPIEKNGSGFTPNLSGRVSDFRQIGGPSARLVIDVGNWDDSRAVNHPGQSGDPDSPHYRDLAPMWSSGQYFPLLYTRKAVESATEKKITLVPKPAQP
jgi:penicillin amidase